MGCSLSSILRCLYIATNSIRHVTDFNTRNKLFTAKVIGTIKSAQPFLNFVDVISIKFQNSMLDLTLLQDGLSEPKFYGDLVNKFRKIYACNDFSTQFRKTHSSI